MARHKITVQDASLAELETLGYWYTLSGAVPEDDQSMRDKVREFTEAKRSGLLGSAAGSDPLGRYQRFRELHPNDLYYACTSVLSIRLDNTTIGMLIMGAHVRLWDILLADVDVSAWDYSQPPEQMPPDLVAFMLAALNVAKLHVVAIHPDHQGHGRGKRLVNHALDRAFKGGTTMVYGQFNSNNHDLRLFYSALGFAVLKRGEPLNLTVATGNPRMHFTPYKDETFFVTYFEPPSAA